MTGPTTALGRRVASPNDKSGATQGPLTRRVSSRFNVVWEPTTAGNPREAGRREVHGVDHAAQYAVALAHARAKGAKS